MRPLITPGVLLSFLFSAFGCSPVEDDPPPQPVIVLAAPLGGEAWAGTKNISWNSANVGSVTIHIEISSDSGANWSTLAAAAPNAGSYAWDTTAQAPGSRFSIRVTAMDGAALVCGPSASSSDFFLLRYEWTRRLGGINRDEAHDVATDGSGNLFLAGLFQGTVDFSADFLGADLKTSAGGEDIFITKVNADGSYGWTRRMGGANSDEARDVATDGAGNVYLAGFFQGFVDFRADFGGTDSKTSTGIGAFVTRINADGSYGWTRVVGGTGTAVSAHGIATDGAGNVFVTGSFGGTVDFRADFGGADSKTSAGMNDIFVMKILADGSYGWTRRMGGTGDDVGADLVADGSGNIHPTGVFQGTVDFRADFGGMDAKTSAGESDVFVMRIHGDGSYGWVRIVGGLGADCGESVATDGAGNVYLTGSIVGTVDFCADFGGVDLKGSVGFTDAFLTKILADGNYGWTRRMGGTGDDCGFGVATDGPGNVFVTGFYSGLVTFGDDFGGTDSKNSAGSSDIFVVSIFPDGAYRWTRRMGGVSPDTGRGIVVDRGGNVHVTGIFQDMADFQTDFGGTESKTAWGLFDTFVTKFK
jgi:hypothetical protein